MCMHNNRIITKDNNNKVSIVMNDVAYIDVAENDIIVRDIMGKEVLLKGKLLAVNFIEGTALIDIKP